MTLPNLLYGFTDEQLVAAVDNSEYGVAKDAPQTATTHPGAYHDTYHDAYHDTYHEKQEVKPNEIKLLRVLASRGELGAVDLRKAMDIKYSSDLRERYLRPLCRAGCIEFTLPNAKRSKLQKYRLTAKGRALIASIDVKQH